MNMEYCRFENTLHDLRECQDAIEENRPIDSECEQKARAELIRLCRQIAEDYGDQIEEF